MNTKLTLNLQQTIIEKAKNYAKSHKTSLSRIIENYLQKLTEDNDDKKKISPLVKSLSGVIKLPKNFDPKKGYTDYLTNKYK